MLPILEWSNSVTDAHLNRLIVEFSDHGAKLCLLREDNKFGYIDAR